MYAWMVVCIMSNVCMFTQIPKRQARQIHEREVSITATTDGGRHIILLPFLFPKYIFHSFLTRWKSKCHSSSSSNCGIESESKNCKVETTQQRNSRQHINYSIKHWKHTEYWTPVYWPDDPIRSSWGRVPPAKTSIICGKWFGSFVAIDDGARGPITTTKRFHDHANNGRNSLRSVSFFVHTAESIGHLGTRKLMSWTKLYKVHLRYQDLRRYLWYDTSSSEHTMKNGREHNVAVHDCARTPLEAVYGSLLCMNHLHEYYDSMYTRQPRPNPKKPEKLKYDPQSKTRFLAWQSARLSRRDST